MDISIFLAKLLGLYMLIIGLAHFIRRQYIKAVIADFYNSPALIAMASVINLLLGLLIVLNHNIWELSWKVIITIIGYMSLVKGIMNLFFPELGRKLSTKVIENDIFVYTGIISFALGLYLVYHGFFAVS